MIYVFDVENQGELYEEDLRDFKQSIMNLSNFSKNANVFTLIHKMDKIKSTEREFIFDQKSKDIRECANGYDISIKDIFATSIWDETLYKAWSMIVQHFIPNMLFIKESLKQLCTICDCDEIVLFDKQTFLIISYHESKPQKDILKYERVSNII